MSDLLLDSLRIQNFRTFRDLTIDRLGRVNLVVGKNNVGKTALLEAVHVYARYKSHEAASELIQDRDLEQFDSLRQVQTSDYGVDIPRERHLFYGRPSLQQFARGDSLEEYPRIRISSEPESNLDLALTIQEWDDHGELLVDYEYNGERGTRSAFDSRVPCVYLRSCGWDNDELYRIWDQIELTSREDQVNQSLRLIDERLERVRFKEGAVSGGNGHRERIAMAKIEGSAEPEPLKSLGQGMNRLFALSLLLIDAKAGILLIDEIENGLHYSVQPDVWRMIFETARELDVQVFATTHSYDCLRAFKRVAEDYDTDDSALVSLRRHEDDPETIVAVEADRDEISIIVEENVEVR